jgi:hypothetical protein
MFSTAGRAALPTYWGAIPATAVPVRWTSVLIVVATECADLDTQVGVGAAIFGRWTAAAVGA